MVQLVLDGEHYALIKVDKGIQKLRDGQATVYITVHNNFANACRRHLQKNGCRVTEWYEYVTGPLTDISFTLRRDYSGKAT